MQQSESFVDAVVLHSRPFQEDNALCELFTVQHGRLAGVVKKVRGRKSSKKALIQPFQGVAVKWRGRGELKTLTHLEAASELSVFLQGKAALCGLYINELMVRLLRPFDPHPDLFVNYLRCLSALKEAENVELPLRIFESALLQELGYAPDWSCHSITGEPLEADSFYYYDPQQGIIDAPLNPSPKVQTAIFLGASLLGIASQDYSDVTTLKEAKRLMRIALQAQLGGKPLQSRKLFI